MEITTTYKLIVIGGSAGSFTSVNHILQELPAHFPIPIVICMHRLKHVNSGFKETLEIVSKNKVVEPFHNDLLEPGHIYIVPANYHMMIQSDMRILFSTEELVNFTRPSIDVLFYSVAQSCGKDAVGIILSGAHKDGVDGLHDMYKTGATTVVQDPQEAQVPTMPQAVLDVMKPHYVFTLRSIIAFLRSLI